MPSGIDGSVLCVGHMRGVSVPGGSTRLKRLSTKIVRTSS
jgi:hypothetical protein